VTKDPARVLHWAQWYATKQARTLGHELFVEADHEVSSTAFVVGSARSGTTWVGEVLSADPDTRFIMEPFDTRNAAFRGGLPQATYLAPGAQNERLGFFCDKVFTGQLRSRWSDQFNHAHHAKRRVVKDVRTVALLGWITARYPAMPTIYVVRHPLATAWSMASLGWGAHGELLAPDGRLDALGERERQVLLRQSFLAEVARWCVEQSRALRHPNPSVQVCFYEDLVADPTSGFGEVAETLRRRSPAWANFQADLDAAARPSATSVRRQAPSTVEGWVETWQGALQAATISEGAELVEEFGLGALYGLEATPRCAPQEIWNHVEVR